MDCNEASVVEEEPIRPSGNWMSFEALRLNAVLIRMIIAVSGKIGSGKSTGANYLRDKYGFKILSSRNLLSSILESKNSEVNRKNLQDLGSDLVALVGPGGLVAIMLEYLPSGDYVLGAVRYPGGINYLRSRYRGQFHHIHLITDDNLRYSRMRARNGLGVSVADFEKADAAPTESGVSELERMADFRIKNVGSLQDLYSELDHIYSSIVV